MKYGTLCAFVLIICGVLLCMLLPQSDPLEPDPISPNKKEETLANGSKSVDKPTSQTLQVQVLWADSKELALGTTVTLTYKRNVSASAATEIEAFSSVLTPKHNTLMFDIPRDASSATLTAIRANATPSSTTLTFPGKPQVTLYLEKTYAVFGTTYFQDDQGTTRTAPGALVCIKGEMGSEILSNYKGKYSLVTTRPRINLRATSGTFFAPMTRSEDSAKYLKFEALNGPYDLFLKEGASLLVSVLEKGSMDAIQNATVRVEDMESKTPFLSDAAGFCEITGVPQRTLEVLVTADGYEKANAVVDIKPGADNAAVFYLKQTGEVRVFTIDAASSASEQIRVPNVPIMVRTAGSPPFYATTVSDAHGCGIFSSVPLDQVLQVQAIHRYSFEIKTVTFKNGSRFADVILKVKSNVIPPKSEANGWISGFIQDVNGLPIKDSTITAWHNRGQASSNSDLAGVFLIEGLSEGRKEIYVIAKKDGYAPAITTTAVNSSVTLTLIDSMGIICKVVDAKTRRAIPVFTVKLDSQKFLALISPHSKASSFINSIFRIVISSTISRCFLWFAEYSLARLTRSFPR